MENLVTASIVLYEEHPKVLLKNIRCLLNSPVLIKLYLIDNSLMNNFTLFSDMGERVEYIHNNFNIGYGAGHNIALKKAISLESKYHFIINPDIYPKNDVFSQMIKYMEIHKGIGLLMPEILNIDGTIQFLPKLLPLPLDVIFRKIKWPIFYYKKFITRYELRNVPSDVSYSTPVLSGCFTLIRIDALKEIGLYDEKFFMYFEDWDLSRRMMKKYKTVYYPRVSVYHEYKSRQSKSLRLFILYGRSYFLYFKKWGWFIDAERNELNQKVIDQFIDIKYDKT